jgi:ABC-type dipeptide/oligopeptide/nickel transport system permease component
MILVMVFVSFLTFGALKIVPGDPVQMLLGEFATQQAVEQGRHQLGLDRSFLEQYILFLGRVIQGDLGVSLRFRLKVSELVLPAFVATLYLTIPSLVISSGIGILSGGISAARLRSWVDYLTSVIVVLGIAAPGFWIAIMLIVIFSLKLGWLPSGGYGFGEQLVLPVLALSINQVALVSRTMKGSMSDALLEQYVQTARAKGLAERAVIWRHALRNALIPVITVLGLRFGSLLGGVVTIETVFGWPGLGRLIVQAALQRDFPVVVGGALLMSFTFVLANLIVDIAYGFVDPRIRRV